MRNPGAIFYAKGEKVKFSSDLLECSLIDLSLLECPSISVDYLTQNCQNHLKGKNNFNKHCAKEKAIFYLNWLTNERETERGSTPVTEFNNLRFDYGGRESESFNFQRRNHKNWKEFLLRKVQLLLTEDEIRSFSHLVYYIEPFLLWRNQNVKNSTQGVLRDLLMSKHPVGEEIDKNDPSLPKEMQHLKEERVHKIVHYDKTETL